MSEQNADKAKYVDIVMTDAPGPTGQFVEVEDQDGRNIRVGKWLQRDDGYWALRISHLPPAATEGDDRG